MVKDIYRIAVGLSNCNEPIKELQVKKAVHLALEAVNDSDKYEIHPIFAKLAIDCKDVNIASSLFNSINSIPNLIGIVPVANTNIIDVLVQTYYLFNLFPVPVTTGSTVPSQLYESPNFYPLFPSNDAIVSAMGELVNALNFKRVSILTSPLSRGDETRVSLELQMETYGIQVATSSIHDIERHYFHYGTYSGSVDDYYDFLYYDDQLDIIVENGGKIILYQDSIVPMQYTIIKAFERGILGPNSGYLWIFGADKCEDITSVVYGMYEENPDVDGNDDENNNLTYAVCVGFNLEPNHSFINDVWNPAVEEGSLTEEELSASGINVTNWTDENMLSEVPFYYDTILWLRKNLDFTLANAEDCDEPNELRCLRSSAERISFGDYTERYQFAVAEHSENQVGVFNYVVDWNGDLGWTLIAPYKPGEGFDQAGIDALTFNKEDSLPLDMICSNDSFADDFFLKFIICVIIFFFVGGNLLMFYMQKMRSRMPMFLNVLRVRLISVFAMIMFLTLLFRLIEFKQGCDGALTALTCDISGNLPFLMEITIIMILIMRILRFYRILRNRQLTKSDPIGLYGLSLLIGVSILVIIDITISCMHSRVMTFQLTNEPLHYYRICSGSYREFDTTFSQALWRFISRDFFILFLLGLAWRMAMYVNKCAGRNDKLFRRPWKLMGKTFGICFMIHITWMIITILAPVWRDPINADSYPTEYFDNDQVLYDADTFRMLSLLLILRDILVTLVMIYPFLNQEFYFIKLAYVALYGKVTTNRYMQRRISMSMISTRKKHTDKDSQLLGIVFSPIKSIDKQIATQHRRFLLLNTETRRLEKCMPVLSTTTHLTDSSTSTTQTDDNIFPDIHSPCSVIKQVSPSLIYHKRSPTLVPNIQNCSPIVQNGNAWSNEKSLNNNDSTNSTDNLTKGSARLSDLKARGLAEHFSGMKITSSHCDDEVSCFANNNNTANIDNNHNNNNSQPQIPPITLPSRPPTLSTSPQFVPTSPQLNPTSPQFIPTSPQLFASTSTPYSPGRSVNQSLAKGSLNTALGNLEVKTDMINTGFALGTIFPNLSSSQPMKITTPAEAFKHRFVFTLMPVVEEKLPTPKSTLPSPSRLHSISSRALSFDETLLCMNGEVDNRRYSFNEVLFRKLDKEGSGSDLGSSEKNDTKKQSPTNNDNIINQTKRMAPMNYNKWDFEEDDKYENSWSKSPSSDPTKDDSPPQMITKYKLSIRRYFAPNQNTIESVMSDPIFGGTLSSSLARSGSIYSSDSRGYRNYGNINGNGTWTGASSKASISSISSIMNPVGRVAFNKRKTTTFTLDLGEKNTEKFMASFKKMNRASQKALVKKLQHEVELLCLAHSHIREAASRQTSNLGSLLDVLEIFLHSCRRRFSGKVRPKL